MRSHPLAPGWEARQSNPPGDLPFKLMLPLWKHVVFVDWHGVLSDDLFWHSIIGRTSHPCRLAIQEGTQRLFQNKPLVQAWMRGEISSNEVVDFLDIPLDRRYRPDYILRRLRDDCRRMRVRLELLTGLRRILGSVFIVVATDNMDCFTPESLASVNLGGVVDDYLVSCRLGNLKLENVETFVSGWLQQHDVQFRHSLLIDDNPNTCKAFQKAGGHAICHESVDQSLEKVAAWRSWAFRED